MHELTWNKFKESKNQIEILFHLASIMGSRFANCSDDNIGCMKKIVTRKYRIYNSGKIHKSNYENKKDEK